MLSTGELSFGYEYMPPAETKKIYVMAYVENAEGVHYGLVEEFDYQNREDSALANDTDIWTGAKATRACLVGGRVPGWVSILRMRMGGGLSQSWDGSIPTVGIREVSGCGKRD